jgi:DNA-binding PadR family transcriptional regulator
MFDWDHRRHGGYGGREGGGLMPRDGRRFAHGCGLGRGRHGWGRGEGRWGHRPFDHGDLRLLILYLISEKPRHGYEVIKAIEEMAGGAYSPSPGVVYPTLTMLEELGYVSVTAAEGGKKLHAITVQGADFLAQNREVVAAILGRAAEAERAGGVPPQIVRAMENLRTALRLRLGRGAPDGVRVRAIAAAIDAAAAEAERD